MQVLLLAISFVCVPWLLVVKPLVLYQRQQAEQQRQQDMSRSYNTSVGKAVISPLLAQSVHDDHLGTWIDGVHERGLHMHSPKGGDIDQLGRVDFCFAIGYELNNQSIYLTHALPPHTPHPHPNTLMTGTRSGGTRMMAQA